MSERLAAQKQAGGLVGRSLCLANQRKGWTGLLTFQAKYLRSEEPHRAREYVAQLAFSRRRKVCSIELAIKMRQKTTIEEQSRGAQRNSGGNWDCLKSCVWNCNMERCLQMSFFSRFLLRGKCLSTSNNFYVRSESLNKLEKKLRF